MIKAILQFLNRLNSAQAERDLNRYMELEFGIKKPMLPERFLYM